MTPLPAGADVVVAGAGVVGAACALRLAEAGARVCVIDSAGPAAGSSSSGEGNLLVSDKLPGPELDLALRSLDLWRDLDVRAGGGFEFERKGGVVVAATAAEYRALTEVAASQRAVGVEAELLAPDRLRELEPELAPDLAGGAWYSQDAQLQPMLAVQRLLQLARALGATVVRRCALTGVDRDASGAVTGVRTARGTVRAAHVVIAAGASSGAVAELLGVRLAVRPRRGHVLVTEALPRLVRHKVYEAGYVADVESDDTGLRASAVVEGTPAGPILIGSSRELVGFDRSFSIDVAQVLAQRAIALFPFLRDVRLIRGYLGFRPASPDHLPIIGELPEAPGVWAATGHEGAGIGLAMGTAELVAAGIAGIDSPLDGAPFTPGRPHLQTVLAHD